MRIIPIAIFNRDGLKAEALSAEVANQFALNKIIKLEQLVSTSPPAWAFLDIPPHPASATKIREKDNEK